MITTNFQTVNIWKLVRVSWESAIPTFLLVKNRKQVQAATSSLMSTNIKSVTTLLTDEMTLFSVHPSTETQNPQRARVRTRKTETASFGDLLLRHRIDQELANTTPHVHYHLQQLDSDRKIKSTELFISTCDMQTYSQLGGSIKFFICVLKTAALEKKKPQLFAKTKGIGLLILWRISDRNAMKTKANYDSCQQIWMATYRYFHYAMRTIVLVRRQLSIEI